MMGLHVSLMIVAIHVSLTTLAIVLCTFFFLSSRGFSVGGSKTKYSMREPISLQVEHVVVEFVVEPSDHLALVFELGRHPPSETVLTPAISTIRGDSWRAGTSFLTAQVQKTCPLPSTAGQLNDINHINILPF